MISTPRHLFQSIHIILVSCCVLRALSPLNTSPVSGGVYTTWWPGHLVSGTVLPISFPGDRHSLTVSVLTKLIINPLVAPGLWRTTFCWRAGQKVVSVPSCDYILHFSLPGHPPLFPHPVKIENFRKWILPVVPASISGSIGSLCPKWSQSLTGSANHCSPLQVSNRKVTFKSKLEARKLMLILTQY